MTDAFQDHVKDLIKEQMSKDLGVKIWRNGQEGPLGSGINPERHRVSIDCARDHLNRGNFTRVFEKYKKAEYLDLLITGKHACCVLVAQAMLVGADVSTQQKEFVRGVYKACGLHKEAIQQMGTALEEYTNGQPYCLIEPDRTDHKIQFNFEKARCKTL